MRWLKNSIFLLLSLTVLYSCKKDSSDNKDDDENEIYYFSAKIDGRAVRYEVDFQNPGSFATGPYYYGSEMDPLYEENNGTTITNSDNDDAPAIVVTILKQFNHEPEFQEKVDVLHLGSFSYGKGSGFGGPIDGVCIFYTDEDGNIWDSETGPQTGSTFSIVELYQNPYLLDRRTMKAEFTCKLYNETGTESIEVKNATILSMVYWAW